MLTIKELFGSVALSLVADQPFYALPVQVAWIKRLGVSDATTYPVDEGRELEMIDEAQYRTLPVLTDEPTSYFRHRRMVVIWPTPLNARTAPLDFRVRPDDMTADTHSPLLPIEFHIPILLKARQRAWSALLNFKDAAVAQNDFVSEIRPLINTDSEETAGQFATIAPIRSRRRLFRSQ